MINNTESVAAAAPVAEPKTKRPRGIFNAAEQENISKAEAVAQAAQETARVSVLDERDIDAEYVSDLIEEAQDARAKSAGAVQFSTAAKNATVDDFKAAHLLLAALREVQKAAKQKYARTNRIALADYLVGKKLNGRKSNLLQTSQTLITKLGSDTLPGITAAKVTKLKNLRAAWVAANNSQIENSTAAQTTRAELKNLLKTINDRRIAIQLAADAEWPHTDGENAALRKEFRLPPHKPLIV